MNSQQTAFMSQPPIWPLTVNLELAGDGGTASLSVHAGLTALVGPNGSGKSRALRAVKKSLESISLAGRKVRFLAAGRSSPLENYRASITGPRHRATGDLAVGHADYVRDWWEIESVTGDLFALDFRPDLKLKVEARLQQLFDRAVSFRWTQNGLSLRLTPVTGGLSYAANHEASGILQLVALLAAIHNDEIGALIIDEPEISLHPQHQAFLLEEMKRVAGEPSDPQRKLIVIATHAPELLDIRNVKDLPRLAFLTDARRVPTQLVGSETILASRSLQAFLARLGATHRTAMFAERVLLVEGPSDEIVVTQLAQRIGMHPLARNAQIVPVTGKGEFLDAAKLFALMGKRVAGLADLDALADDPRLVLYIGSLPDADDVAAALGHASISKLDADLRGALGAFMEGHSAEVDAAAALYIDWSSNSESTRSRRRVTLARVLTEPASFGGDAGRDAERLSKRYVVLLNALAGLGWFFVRAGAIENCYSARDAGPKPFEAAVEAATFADRTVSDLEARYPDVLGALRFIAPGQLVDEDLLLRPKLGAALSAVFLTMEHDTPSAQLDAIAANVVGADAALFKFENASSGPDSLRVRVSITSPIFARSSFPFEVGADEDVLAVCRRVLPGETAI
jgi:hypothetical protein